MADPTKYTPAYSYSGWQASNPSRPLPADEVDNDFANVSLSVNQTIDALKDVRRSDGKLKNQSVGPDQLSPALTIGFTFTGSWVDGRSYSAGDGVVLDDTFYSARVAHVADVANAPGNDTYWNELFSLNDIVVTGGMALPRDTFVGDGVTKDFSLSFTPLSKYNLFVQFGGVVQTTDTYSANGNTLTFITAPPSGYGIEVRGFATVSALVTPEDGSVTTSKLADLAVTEAKLAVAVASKLNSALQPADIGTTVQAYNANLTTLASVTPGLAGTSILAMAAATDVRSFLDVAAVVEIRAQLKALDPAVNPTALYTEAGRGGIFIWRTGDYSAKIAADPQEGIYIKADGVDASEGAWVRLYEGPLLATWFGAATSNGAAANDAAINAAFALAISQSNVQRRAVRIPAGNWTVENLLIDHAGLQFALSGDGEFATVLWRAASEATELFRVKAEGVSITDLTIQQPSYVSGDGSVGVLVKKDYGSLVEGALPTADSDFSMSRVRVIGFNTGVEHWGRGFNTDGCSLSLCGWGSVLQWPNEGDYTEGSQPVQLDETGFRYFQHANIRGHSNGFGLFRNDGANAHKINGVQISGVSMDIGRRLWQGVLRQGAITDFAVTQTPTPAFTLTDGSEDYVIAAGTIQGDTVAERVPVYCIELTGDQSSGGFRDILMKQCTSHGIYHDGSGVATDMVLDGLDFVDVCTTTAGANPIRFNGANHTVYVDNVTLDVASALTGVVRGTSSSATIRVGRVRSLRAFTRPLDSTNSGCLMDVGRYFSGPSTTGNYEEFLSPAGNLNGRITQSTSGVRIVVNDTLNIWIGFGSGSPETFEAAGIGSVYWDVTNGVQYNKKSGANTATGWKLVTQAA